jgi:electron transport complex protein RnfB
VEELRDASLAARVDALLPQMQCRRCGFDGCAPYAAAIAAGAPINRCPPGGEALIGALAALTGRRVVPIDPACGVETPCTVARIDEARCIGCTRCLDACPVDAIAGAAKHMHAVLPALCTGCALCIPPCPVDCIAMIAAGRAWSPEDARAAKLRHDAQRRRRAGASRGAKAPPEDAERTKRRRAIAAALARARGRRTPEPRST